MRTKTCPTCRGTRKVMNFGCMYIDCETCGGTGKIELDKFVCEMCKKEILKDAADSIVEKEINSDIEIKKQRRKKIVSEMQNVCSA